MTKSNKVFKKCLKFTRCKQVPVEVCHQVTDTAERTRRGFLTSSLLTRLSLTPQHRHQELKKKEETNVKFTVRY